MRPPPDAFAGTAGGGTLLVFGCCNIYVFLIMSLGLSACHLVLVPQRGRYCHEGTLAPSLAVWNSGSLGRKLIRLSLDIKAGICFESIRPLLLVFVCFFWVRFVHFVCIGLDCMIQWIHKVMRNEWAPSHTTRHPPTHIPGRYISGEEREHGSGNHEDHRQKEELCIQKYIWLFIILKFSSKRYSLHVALTGIFLAATGAAG